MLGLGVVFSMVNQTSAKCLLSSAPSVSLSWLPPVCQALFPEAEAAVGSQNEERSTLPPAPKLLPAGQGAPTINLNFHSTSMHY